MAKRISVYVPDDERYERFAEAAEKDDRKQNNAVNVALADYADKVLGDEDDVDADT